VSASAAAAARARSRRPLRGARAAPHHLVGAPLYDLVVRPLRDAGLPVVELRLPFPGSGEQRRFLEGFPPLVGE